MIGGQPVLPPGYYPYQPVAQPTRQPILPRRQAAPMARNGGTQQSAAQGKVRLQGQDNEAATRPNLPPLPMPTPEELGLGAKSNRTGEVDWTGVRQRLERVSASSFHLQKVSTGFRFSCVVPNAAGERRRVEAEAASEAEAIDRALALAERGG